MWIWIGLIFLAVIILLLILVLLSNIHIEASIKTRDTQAEMEFRVKLIYGAVRFHYELPAERFEELKRQLAQVVTEKLSEKKGKDGSQDAPSTNKRGKRGFNYQIKDFVKSAYGLRIWETNDFSMLRITKFTWQTRLGTEDVVTTSILTGLLWGIKNTMLGWLSYKVKFTDGPDLKVNAIWEEQWTLDTLLEFRAYIRFFRLMKIFRTISRGIVNAHGGIWAWRRELS
ncbi:DUF2953 domain-containing protein [Paenibacillus gallinarum]|uniref:DUF2953 domain-containing protein n=1 Tax=Paenibacillus gallinarum TaxID=2762232 RepID=A0ABR8SXC9_9BACL|nr:DUF2953 domain-containing protein [Paenibacillus gallinarum]MBD7967999.1 DUF2953 domain-containing protein [Paenibacillus gallinarum]